MRRAPIRTLTTIVCALLSVAWIAPAGRVPPRPVEVSEVDEAPTGEVVVEPAQLRLSLAPANADLAQFRVVNGAEREVSLEVEALPVGAGPGGAPVVPAEGDPVPSAADWVELPSREVHLGPSEAAAFRPAVTAPEGTAPGGYITALRFKSTGSDDLEVTAFVLVEVPPEDDGTDPPPEPGVDVSLQRIDRTSAVATATFDAGRRGAVDVTGTLQVRSWYGTTLIDTAIPSTVVLPTVPRVREITFRAPVLPGPYQVALEDVAVPDAPDLQLGSASSRAWLWNPAAVIALAVVLLFVTAWLVWRAVRR